MLDYVRELANEIREIAKGAMREIVIATITETLKSDVEDSRLNTLAAQKIIEKHFKGRSADKMTMEELFDYNNEMEVSVVSDDEYECEGYPFSIKHKPNTPPGCYLILGALHDYAASHPEEFGPIYAPLLYNGFALNPVEILFEVWVHACESLELNNETALRVAIAAAKADLEERRIETESKPPEKKRGRKARMDLTTARKAYDAWNTGHYGTKAELARTLGGDWTDAKVKTAIDRCRKIDNRTKNAKSPRRTKG